jgi:hypothetical protein
MIAAGVAACLGFVGGKHVPVSDRDAQNIQGGDSGSASVTVVNCDRLNETINITADCSISTVGSACVVCKWTNESTGHKPSTMNTTPGYVAKTQVRVCRERGYGFCDFDGTCGDVEASGDCIDLYVYEVQQ